MRMIGGFVQGEDESIVYTITTTNWGSTPTAVSFAVKDATRGLRRRDVTATVMPGVATVLGDVITLPALASLTPFIKYRIEVKFTAGGNTYEAYFEVIGEH